MAIQHPVKFLKSYITNISALSTYSVAPFATVTNKWSAVISIPTAQLHGDTTTTNSGIYDGRDVNVGDYIASTGEGRILKISAITSKTYNSVSCTLEDVDIYNALEDNTQSYEGLISNGLSTESYIFEVKSGRPILATIPSALPGNLPPTFASAIYARFATIYPNMFKIADGSTLRISKDITDTLNFVSGSNISLAFDDTAKSISISSSIPTASASILGGIKVGAGLSIDASGILSANITSLAWSGITSKPTTLSGYGITDALALTGGTLTGALTLNADPTNALHAATKQYVDNAITGLDFKQSVKVISTSNITLSGTQTIDGIALVVGDRVLVVGQTTSSQNGIYVVSATAWTRATDADNSGSIAEVSTGMYCFVEQGTANANSGWILTTTGTITLGTTGLAFAQFNGLGQVTAGTGLTKSGSTLSLASGVATVGTYNSVSVDTYGRVTAGTNPTTLAGHGITDGQLKSADLTAIAGLTGTSGILTKTAASTWSLDTNTYALSSHIHSVATSSTNGFMSSTDKAKLDAYPTAVVGASVGSIFNFVVNFDGATGNPLSTGGVTSLPSGWTATVSGADVTITHNAGVPIKMINYWGRTTSTGTDHFRLPTSANELTIPYANINTQFTFRINTSIAGADAGGTARIIAYF